jgi:hypothetical protein
MYWHRLATAIALGLIVSGCGGIVNPSSNTVDPFSGTFDIGGGGELHLFSAGKNGEFFVTLTALSPDSTAFVGIFLGQQNSGGCQQIFGYGSYSSNFAQLNRQALGGPLDKGNYCLQVYDSGYSTLSGPQTYTVRVSHP